MITAPRLSHIMMPSKETAERYPPMTRTFFPHGSFDLEWVDTSLRMVDLQTEEPRYITAKPGLFIH